MADAQPGAEPTFPVLAAALHPVLGADAATGSCVGPRHWWRGALDVEGLAIGSVGAVIAALAVYDPGRSYATSSELVAASFNSIAHLRMDGRAPEVWAPMSGFRRARDGWVRLHANYPHHAQRLMVALGINDADQLDAALAERDALDIEETVTAAGGIATAVRTAEEWAATDRGRAAASRAWIEFSLSSCDPAGSRTPTLRGEPAPPSTLRGGPAEWGSPDAPESRVTRARWGRPLDGIRVLDLTRVIAGPCGTRLLGALGADVLRIDPPQTPELVDSFVDGGFDKRSAVVDLRDAGQAARVRELAATADAVVLGYRPGALAAYGLDADSLRTGRRDLAVVSVNAWGSEFERRGFDSIVQAACGIADIYGAGDGDTRKPGALPVQALDHATGMGVAAAVIALLVARRNGRCGSAELSLSVTAARLMAEPAPPSGDPDELDVRQRETPSPYGMLQHVPPLLTVDGEQLEFSAAPVDYGSSALAWEPPRRDQA